MPSNPWTKHPLRLATRPVTTSPSTRASLPNPYCSPSHSPTPPVHAMSRESRRHVGPTPKPQPLVAAGRPSGRPPEAPSQRTPDRHQIARLETNRFALQCFRPTRDVDRVHG